MHGLWRRSYREIGKKSQHQQSAIAGNAWVKDFLYLPGIIKIIAQLLTVRPATINDAGLIADMSRRTFYDTFAAVNTRADMDLFMNGPFNRQRLVAEVGKPGFYFFTAFEDGNPVGYAKMSEGETPPGLDTPATIEIARIYAVKEAIGRGVGKALMQQCLDFAKARGKTAVWLGVWEKNEQAIAFYTHWGFERFGEHDFVLGNDVQKDWLMKKLI
jgi:ribosomal protein S18 acetylase RimI-like enzyme